MKETELSELQPRRSLTAARSSSVRVLPIQNDSMAILDRTPIEWQTKFRNADRWEFYKQLTHLLTRIAKATSNFITKSDTVPCIELRPHKRRAFLKPRSVGGGGVGANLVSARLPTTYKERLDFLPTRLDVERKYKSNNTEYLFFGIQWVFTRNFHLHFNFALKNERRKMKPANGKPREERVPRSSQPR